MRLDSEDSEAEIFSQTRIWLLSIVQYYYSFQPRVSTEPPCTADMPMCRYVYAVREAKRFNFFPIMILR